MKLYLAFVAVAIKLIVMPLHSQDFILNDTPAGYRPLVWMIGNFARNHSTP